MKSPTPHDPFDELIAAALHGELSPAERASFDSRLDNDPAARAAYQEAQLMHELFEKTHQSAQPDAAFEQRMVSGVRRKLKAQDQPPETAWESVLVLCEAVRAMVRRTGSALRPRKSTSPIVEVAVVLGIIAILAGVALGPITNGIKKAKQSPAVFSTKTNELSYASAGEKPNESSQAKDMKQALEAQGLNYVQSAQPGVTMSGYVDTSYTKQFAGSPQPFATVGTTQVTSGGVIIEALKNSRALGLNSQQSDESDGQKIARNEPVGQKLFGIPTSVGGGTEDALDLTRNKNAANFYSVGQAINESSTQGGSETPVSTTSTISAPTGSAVPSAPAINSDITKTLTMTPRLVAAANEPQRQTEEKSYEEIKDPAAPVNLDWNPKGKLPAGKPENQLAKSDKDANAAEDAPPDPSRKLIRNAQLDLEVKSYETAVDDITALTRLAGGYVDTSDSHKGGNGKLQGTVTVKVLPQKLDGFLLRLRSLGTIANQSVSTNDVTKDYYDTESRLANSRKMETQLQELLKRTNGKVAELLQVERELGRVRGEIEQMQGSLKYIDFQVQYATVKIEMKEKDLNQTAAYLLKEKDNFSLFATDVEATFQKARAVADDFKAQVLQANLNHESGSNVSAELVVMVAPGDIESFLVKIRDLGRVANFTRETERVAQDGGDTDRPADQTLTEKDKVEVHLSIRSDDETRKQVALTVVTPTVDTAFDAAKKVALEQPGTAILASSLNRTPQGQATARLTVRVPGVAYPVLIEALGKLGRTASLSIQRNDNSGPGANGDDAPVIVSLALTDEEAPLQVTELSVQASEVDALAQQLKKDALAAGVEVKASNFSRQADGSEMAQLAFRLPMGKNAAFLEALKKSGKVEALTVQRSDQLRSDDTAPAAIVLRLHNQRDLVPDNTGVWATLRQTFGDGAGALLGSIKLIGVIVAFLAPWVVTMGFLAWVGRRIYVGRKGRK